MLSDQEPDSKDGKTAMSKLVDKVKWYYLLYLMNIEIDNDKVSDSQ